MSVLIVFFCILNFYSPCSAHISSTKSFNSSDLLSMILQVNESTLKHYVELIQGFGPHPTGSQTLDHLKTYLDNEFIADGLVVQNIPWRYKFRNGENIEATLLGKGSGNGIVIVCAHYDSVSVSPGADDDGSGVASVLSLAVVMSQYSYNATIKFVLFSGEEQGIFGSHEYAKEAKKRGDNIIGVITLDGIGYAASPQDTTTVRNYADNQSDWIFSISNTIAETYANFIDLNIQRFPNAKISDHQSFYDNGYTTSYFLESTLNPYYHSSEDTVDKMNFTYLTKISRLALGTISLVAEHDRLLANDDLQIHVQGIVLSYPGELVIRIENKRYPLDTANVSIHIEMKNLFTGAYVQGQFNSSSNWIISTEIADEWVFTIASHMYHHAPIILVVTVEGFHDDVGVFTKQQTYGFVFKGNVFLLPM